MDDHKHKMHANSSPGFFLEWEIRAGMRYSEIWVIGDHDRFKAGDLASPGCNTFVLG